MLVEELEQSGQADRSAATPRVTAWHVATLALLAFGYSAYYFCRSDYSVALPLIIAEQVKRGVDPHVAELRLGSIASFGVLAYAIGKVPAGAIADRFGGKGNFLGGMFGSIAFTLLFIAGGGFPIFTVAWIANRFIQSLGWAGLVKITSRWFSHSTYGSVMALLSLSYLFGDAIAREVMSLLLERGMGWRGLFVTGAGILGLLLICNLIFLRESPAAYNLPLSEERPLIQFAHSDHTTKQVRVKEIFKGLFSSWAFWVVCFLSLGTTLLRETFNLWMPTYLNQSLGMSSAQAARGSAIFPFFGGVSVLLAGWLSDSLGVAGRSRILFGGIALSAVMLIALALVPAKVSTLLPLSLVGAVAFFLIGPYSYLSGAMSLDFGGKEGGATASGIVDSFGYLAGAFSGNGVAHIAVTYGWRSLFFVLAAIAALSSMVAASLVWQQDRASPVPN
ncbi:MAG: MFS transporter [Acidobacteria bacterium]|nr:MFS transporter [Acidobacteriota bacterium]